MKAIAQILIIILLFYSPSISQVYVVNAYKGDHFPKQAVTVFIDLETKKILKEIPTGDEGAIINKKALPVLMGDDTLLITAAMEGCYCDNCVVGKNRAKIAVFNPASMQLVYSYADSDIFIDTFESQPGCRVYIGGGEQKEPRDGIYGDYILGKDFKIALVKPRSYDYAWGLIFGVKGFTYLQQFVPEKNLYLSYSLLLHMNNEHSLALDTCYLYSNYIIVDSAMSAGVNDRSHILAAIDTIIYDFNLNNEFYGETITKTYELGRINPFVKLFNINTFAQLDSFPVADYPKGDYPDGNNDVADVVGPYIVYYFFGREGIEKYAPAMLFIFDTRTNEATWLRVGWR
jgi:hypothetical protein